MSMKDPKGLGDFLSIVFWIILIGFVLALF